MEDGSFVILVGPSGCGKSTLLRMIAGLESVSGGEICIGDQIVNDMQPKDHDIAMVFQNYALYPHMNVRRNMGFSLELKNVKQDEIDRNVMRAANILGLENLLDCLPRQLSGGQRQLFQIMMIAAGYEDGNDVTDLRHDPSLKIALERNPQTGAALWSRPTISRMENLPEARDLIRMGQEMVHFYCQSFARAPGQIVLGIHNPFDAVRGKRCFHPVVSAFRIFGHAILQMSFAGGWLWSTKMSTGWRFPVGGACRGSRF